jgi:hypothetical protein
MEMYAGNNYKYLYEYVDVLVIFFKVIVADKGVASISNGI